MNLHTQKWFYNRIGKAIYRLPLNPFYGVIIDKIILNIEDIIQFLNNK